jgi:hypothetical protein
MQNPCVCVYVCVSVSVCALMRAHALFHKVFFSLLSLSHVYGVKCFHFELQNFPLIQFHEISSSFSGQPFLFRVSSYMSLWSNILFNCAVLINLIVAFFYPFMDTVPSKCHSYIASQDVALCSARCFQFLTCVRQVQKCTWLPAS